MMRSVQCSRCGEHIDPPEDVYDARAGICFECLSDDLGRVDEDSEDEESE